MFVIELLDCVGLPRDPASLPLTRKEHHCGDIYGSADQTVTVPVLGFTTQQLAINIWGTVSKAVERQIWPYPDAHVAWIAKYVPVLSGLEHPCQRSGLSGFPSAA